MISLTLARELRAAGLVWQPAHGDRFVVDLPDMANDVFVLGDMTVEVHDFPTGLEIGFNGTTEWALDSVPHRQALWLPAEEQLRDLLGGAFRRLERTDAGHRVLLDVGGRELTFEAPVAADAYGHGLLHLLTAAA